MAEQLFQIGIKGLVRNEVGHILMVHVPEWGENPAHWDFPGGRMDPGETFLDTLHRELQEEIGVTYAGEPKQLMSVLTTMCIPVGDIKYPLVLNIYDVSLPRDSDIRLDPRGVEDAYKWFTPHEAADVMGVKFSADFCNLVRDM